MIGPTGGIPHLKVSTEVCFARGTDRSPEQPLVAFAATRVVNHSLKASERFLFSHPQISDLEMACLEATLNADLPQTYPNGGKNNSNQLILL